MASSFSRKDNGSLLFQPQKPHFFKIILENIIQEKKLCIPRRFVRIHGSNLSDRIVLKVPSGAKWQVDVVKNDGEIWLENGLQEFMDYYSITYGDFLVFAYDHKNCGFDVIICDKTASEIEYPFSGINEEENEGPDDFHQMSMNQEIKEDSSVEEISGHSQPCRKRRGKSPLSSPQPHKKTKLNTEQVEATGETDSEADSEATKTNGGMCSCKRRRRRRRRIVSRSLTQEEKDDAIKRASANFKSTKPCCWVAVHPSSVHPVYRGITIPSNFAKKYMYKSHGKAVLKVSDGRTWSVGYRAHLSSSKRRTTICQGWKKFAKSNHLRPGDVCAFELVKIGKTKFKVHIFPHIEAGYCSPSSSGNKQLKGGIDHQKNSSSSPLGNVAFAENDGETNFEVKTVNGEMFSERKGLNSNISKKALTRDEKLDAIEKAMVKLKSKNPFFMVAMQASFVAPKYDWAVIPMSFVKKHLPEDHYNCTLIALDGKTSSVDLVITRTGCWRARISHGWKKFAQENQLEFGDVCSFELVDPASTTFKVVIFRKNGLSSSPDSIPLETDVVQMPSDPIPSMVSEAAKKFTSVDPFFRAVIRSYHLRVDELYVPKHFMAEYRKQSPENVMLKYQSKQWPAKIISYIPYNHGRLTGWLTFAKENSVQVGDTCIFKLVNGGTVLLEVYIFRHVS